MAIPVKRVKRLKRLKHSIWFVLYALLYVISRTAKIDIYLSCTNRASGDSVPVIIDYKPWIL